VCPPGTLVPAGGECSASSDTACEACPPAPQNKRYAASGVCVLECVEGMRPIFVSPGSDVYTCEACPPEACEAGTRRPARPTSCADCEACAADPDAPPLPAGAAYEEGCRWACPTGTGLAVVNTSSGAEACVTYATGDAAALAPAPEPVRGPAEACQPGSRLARAADRYECVPCQERTPVAESPPTWQWKISPCDQPEDQGWECLPGWFQFQEFPDAATQGLSAPLPECLSAVERARRLRQMRASGSSVSADAQFQTVASAPAAAQEGALGPVHIVLFALGGTIALVLMCFLALQHGAEVEAEGGMDA